MTTTINSDTRWLALAVRDEVRRTILLLTDIQDGFETESLQYEIIEDQIIRLQEVLA